MADLIAGAPKRGWILHAALAAAFIVVVALFATWLMNRSSEPEVVTRPPSIWPQAEDKGVIVALGSLSPEVLERQAYLSLDIPDGKLAVNARQLEKRIEIGLVVGGTTYRAIAVQATQLSLPGATDHARLGLVVRFGPLPKLAEAASITLQVRFPRGAIRDEDDVLLRIDQAERALKQ